MKAKIHFIHQLLCLMLCFALLIAHTAVFSLKAFEGDAVEGVTAGDFYYRFH